MTTIQAPLIPRPIMRLASLVLAGMAIIIIVSTILDFWQATPNNPPGLYERQSPAPNEIQCYDDGEPIYDPVACLVPTVTPAININAVSGFRTGSGIKGTP